MLRIKIVYLVLSFAALLSARQARSAGIDGEVHNFLHELEKAYNTRDLTLLRNFVGDASQEWILEECKLERDTLQMRLVSLSIQAETNASVEVITISIPDNRRESINMVFKLGKSDNSLRLLDVKTPSIETHNQELREARDAAVGFSSAINNRETNSVLRWVGETSVNLSLATFTNTCHKRGLGWVSDAIVLEQNINLQSVARRNAQIEARFIVNRTDGGKGSCESAVFDQGSFKGLSEATNGLVRLSSPGSTRRNDKESEAGMRVQSATNEVRVRRSLPIEKPSAPRSKDNSRRDSSTE